MPLTHRTVDLVQGTANRRELCQAGCRDDELICAAPNKHAPLRRNGSGTGAATSQARIVVKWEATFRTEHTKWAQRADFSATPLFVRKRRVRCGRRQDADAHQTQPTPTSATVALDRRPNDLVVFVVERLLTNATEAIEE